MRPCSGHASLLRAGLASDSLWIGYRRFFGLRTLLAVSSVACSRIEFVAWAAIGPISSTDYPFTSSCSPPHLAVTQLLSVTGVKLRQRGTSTLQCTLTLKRTRRGHPPPEPSPKNGLRPARAGQGSPSTAAVLRSARYWVALNRARRSFGFGSGGVASLCPRLLWWGPSARIQEPLHAGNGNESRRMIFRVRNPQNQQPSRSPRTLRPFARPAELDSFALAKF